MQAEEGDSFIYQIDLSKNPLSPSRFFVLSISLRRGIFRTYSRDPCRSCHPPLFSVGYEIAMVSQENTISKLCLKAHLAFTTRSYISSVFSDGYWRKSSFATASYLSPPPTRPLPPLLSGGRRRRRRRRVKRGDITNGTSNTGVRGRGERKNLSGPE